MSTSAFAALLDDLRSRCRAPDRIDDLLRDEHARFALYRTAIANLDTDGWLPVVLADPDITMADAVLVEAVDARASGMEAADFEHWAGGVLAEFGDRSFVRSRAREWLIYNRLGSDDSAVGELLEASDWLQRRAAGKLTSRPALVALAESGRTTRIRSAAAQRLRTEGLE
jgi:hypothetical protein